MKKFINKIDDIVEEMIDGIVLSNPDTIARIKGYDVLVKKTIDKNKVAIISGGGSGHEPAHGGFIGKGMLDAAVCGPVFTSPAADQVLAAIKATAGPKGALLVIKNYTGDVLNFQMAAQMAEMEGINVESIIVDDDISLQNSTYTTGQRGIIGTIFVHKIVGAAAQDGKNLNEIKTIAEKAITNIASYGIGLDACIVPANGKKGFEIADDEMEVGLGIHGEPGVRREKLKTADESAAMLINEISNNLKLTKDDEIGLIINGVGATPLMELNILARKAILMLQEKEVKIIKTFVGNYMTSMEMPGFLISIIKLDKELKSLLQAQAITNGLVVL